MMKINQGPIVKEPMNGVLGKITVLKPESEPVEP
jgi:hypothetical protein